MESEFFVLDGMWSMFVGMTLVCLIEIELYMFDLTSADGFSRSSHLGPSVLFGANEILQSVNTREWEREYRPCVNLHREKCETEVCFLHIQLIGTNVWLPKIHKTPPDVDFESSRSPQNQSPETILVCIVVLYFPHEKIAWIHMRDECMRSNVLSVCHKHWSIWWSHEQVCSPTRGKYRHLRTICEQTFWQFSNRSHFFFLELVVVNAWCCDFV